MQHDKEMQSTNFDIQKRRLISPKSKKIKIQQNVENPNTRNIPYYVKRAIEDPKKIVLERRSGEGSKPLFDREEVRVNPTPDKRSKEKRSSNSSDDDYFRRRRSRERSKSESSHGSSRSRSTRRERYKTRSYRRNTSHSPKKKDDEKVPYFIDSVREQDRIRQKYKSTRKHSRSRSKETKSRDRRRSRNRSHSRSRTRSRSSSRRRRRSSSRSYRRRHRSPSWSNSYLRATPQPFIPVVPPTWMPPPIVRYPPYMLRPLAPVIPPPPPPFPRPPFGRQRFPRFRQNFRP